MTKSWRPENWTKNPCIDCPNKVTDAYGLFCSIACGQATAYTNYEAGADAMLKALFQMALKSPTGTFVVDSREVNVYLKGD